MITKDDVSKALAKLDLSAEEELAKGDQEDLEPENGAADEAGSLKSEGENMNDKHDNKKGKGKIAEKSFHDDMPAEVEAKVEVSTFLKSLVDYTGSQIDDLRDALVKGDAAQDARFEDIMESVDGLQKSMGNIGIVLKAVCEKIGILESRPAAPKAVTSVAQTVEKSFVGMEADASADDGVYKSLSGKAPIEIRKSISDAMIDLVKKGEMSDTDLINFETFGYVTPEADKKLRTIL